MLMLLALALIQCTAAFTLMPSAPTTASRGPLAAAVRAPLLLRMQAVRGYFATEDVRLVERNEDTVLAWQQKERNRYLVVYEEEPPDPYVGDHLEFYPGDRVEVVADVQVKEWDAKGLQGVVTGTSCQTLSTSLPVTVLLEVQS